MASLPFAFTPMGLFYQLPHADLENLKEALSSGADVLKELGGFACMSGASSVRAALGTVGSTLLFVKGYVTENLVFGLRNATPSATPGSATRSSLRSALDAATGGSQLGLDAVEAGCGAAAVVAQPPASGAAAAADNFNVADTEGGKEESAPATEEDLARADEQTVQVEVRVERL
jgi:hypothetical protein